jgi:hypothetical protein
MGPQRGIKDQTGESYIIPKKVTSPHFDFVRCFMHTSGFLNC